MTLPTCTEIDNMDVRLLPVPEDDAQVVVREEVSVEVETIAEVVTVESHADDLTVVAVLPVNVSDGDRVKYDVEKELVDFVAVVGVTVGIGDKCDREELMPSPLASALSPLAPVPSPPSTVVVEVAFEIETHDEDNEELLLRE